MKEKVKESPSTATGYPNQNKPLESSEVKNANAAGDGAMERKDTELLNEENDKKPLESNY